MFKGSDCPVQADPNMTATPPGPFCFPCTDIDFDYDAACRQTPTTVPTSHRVANTTTPTIFPSTVSPSISPVTQDPPLFLPTAIPSQTSPTQAPSLVPTSTKLVAGQQTFSFSSIRLRLQGAQQLTAASRRAFEETTEAFICKCIMQNNNAGNTDNVDFWTCRMWS